MGLSNGRKDHVRHSRAITRTPRWRALRAEVIERDGGACRQCGARGRLEVDHIKPVRTHPALAWAKTNLQCLCPACHAAKTRVECGHPTLPEPRRDWQAAVAELEAPGRARPKPLSILEE
ncbi:MAG: HNH endonuclease [Gemmobacter sp.]